MMRPCYLISIYEQVRGPGPHVTGHVISGRGRGGPVVLSEVRVGHSIHIPSLPSPLLLPASISVTPVTVAVATGNQPNPRQTTASSSYYDVVHVSLCMHMHCFLFLARRPPISPLSPYPPPLPISRFCPV